MITILKPILKKIVRFILWKDFIRFYYIGSSDKTFHDKYEYYYHKSLILKRHLGNEA